MFKIILDFPPPGKLSKIHVTVYMLHVYISDCNIARNPPGGRGGRGMDRRKSVVIKLSLVVEHRKYLPLPLR